MAQPKRTKIGKTLFGEKHSRYQKSAIHVAGGMVRKVGLVALELRKERKDVGLRTKRKKALPLEKGGK